MKGIAQEDNPQLNKELAGLFKTIVVPKIFNVVDRVQGDSGDNKACYKDILSYMGKVHHYRKQESRTLILSLVSLGMIGINKRGIIWIIQRGEKHD